jgi:hypothetical protein
VRTFSNMIVTYVNVAKKNGAKYSLLIVPLDHCVNHPFQHA